MFLHDAERYLFLSEYFRPDREGERYVTCPASQRPPGRGPDDDGSWFLYAVSHRGGFLVDRRFINWTQERQVSPLLPIILVGVPFYFVVQALLTYNCPWLVVVAAIALYPITFVGLAWFFKSPIRRRLQSKQFIRFPDDLSDELEKLELDAQRQEMALRTLAKLLGGGAGAVAGELGSKLMGKAVEIATEKLAEGAGKGHLQRKDAQEIAARAGRDAP